MLSRRDNIKGLGGTLPISDLEGRLRGLFGPGESKKFMLIFVKANFQDSGEGKWLTYFGANLFTNSIQEHVHGLVFAHIRP